MRRRDSAWHVDEHPAGRLVWLFVGIALPLVIVAARLAQLDCWLVDDYVAAFETTTESLESVPSLDGRIYGSDGRVLAEDVERDNIRVHYRWLQDPPDPRWLQQQALSKLPRLERRNRARVDAEKQSVLKRRDAMWKRLAELSGHPFAAPALVRHMAQDKKAEGGALTFILARGLGAVGTAPLIADTHGTLMARGALSQALDQQIAGGVAGPDQSVKIGVSFRTTDKLYCRTFQVVRGDGLAGLACRAPAGWQVRVTAASPSALPRAKGYRTAASAIPPAISASVDAMIDGSPLDGQAETAARAKGWRH